MNLLERRGSTSGPRAWKAPTFIGVGAFAIGAAAGGAGAAPVYRDDPGYGKHLDRDGDGIGCE